MTEREIMLRKIAANDFAMTDLHLYLDTHPNSTAISRKLDEYRIKNDVLKKEFEERFGPLMQSNENGNRWAWIANPWPWETDSKEEC